ncbi:ABC transporter ATP-binding protein [Anaerocolumna xylanovorans]|uniref:ABC-2 type transport system ATP-binding protein n=1 Tax=Anaerocolumna xylanovorans DSM 12503 TaxID=1121345 RepID=A0A1M7YKD8_9FIRM|nr:ABC transporter ATP-binding protein [Anaerocolumna xylanovorans]SHO53089.1 ABC-2 type transport system ATP-binding protein [Anaerocolumna xylanovorans DSM 12503]
MIEVTRVTKTFKVARRSAGLKEALKSFVHRQYQEVRALNDISFTIGDGEMVGYIGPNGAGKSSTIKILSGILTPDGGNCLVNGKVPWKERVEHVKDIGVVFGQRSQLWWDVPILDSYELIRDIYRVKEAEYRKNLSELTELLDLGEILRTPARQLSLGQRMRCEIGASLLHSPKILFLDEPTIGLDAVSKIAVRNFILERNRQHGTTVILTTHDMQDIEALTKRILLIGKGKILLDGNLEEVKGTFSKVKQLTVQYSGAVPKMAEGMRLSVKEQEVREQSLSGQGILTIQVDTDVLKVSEAISYLSSQTEITDISVAGASLDDVVVGLYKQYEI